MHGANLADKQPAKIASLESHWTTQSNAPLFLFLIPDELNERNLVEIGKIPGGLSMLARHTPTAVRNGSQGYPEGREAAGYCNLPLLPDYDHPGHAIPSSHGNRVAEKA